MILVNKKSETVFKALERKKKQVQKRARDLKGGG